MFDVWIEDVSATGFSKSPRQRPYPPSQTSVELSCVDLLIIRPRKLCFKRIDMFIDEHPDTIQAIPEAE